MNDKELDRNDPTDSNIEYTDDTTPPEQFSEKTPALAHTHHKYDRLTSEQSDRRKLTGMYKDWFLDYASYVILERAVPHIEDGLKPVQRRILHAMRRMDDGRYNKVANIIVS